MLACEATARQIELGWIWPLFALNSVPRPLLPPTSSPSNFPLARRRRRRQHAALSRKTIARARKRRRLARVETFFSCYTERRVGPKEEEEELQKLSQARFFPFTNDNHTRVQSKIEGGWEFTICHRFHYFLLLVFGIFEISSHAFATDTFNRAFYLLPLPNISPTTNCCSFFSPPPSMQTLE